MKKFHWIVVFLLVVGIYFRVVNVGDKVYTVDEVRGIMRASGWNEPDFLQQIHTGEVITASELQQYQRISGGRTPSDTVSALLGNPEHPPLYYLLIRLALQGVNQPIVARGLAIVFSLLTLPALYWLVLELFEQVTVAQIAIALLALSPMQILLAQEARQYSLWALLTLVSSTYLLRSLKRNHWRDWGLYGLTALAGIYTHLFFAWVLIAHGLYVCLLDSGRFTQRLWRYLIVSGGVGIAFLPWVWVIITQVNRFEETTQWAASYQTDLLERLKYWLSNLGVGFVDFDWPVTFRNPLAYLLAGLIGYSLYYLVRRTPSKIWLFLLLMLATTTLTQVIPDILLGGRRSLLPRYLLPAYLVLDIAIAYTVAEHLWPSVQQRLSALQIWGWRAIATCLILGGLISGNIVSQSLAMYKGSTSINVAISNRLNQANHPLIISDTSYTFSLSLTYRVKPETEFWLYESDLQPASVLDRLPALLSKDRDIFLYAPSKDFLKIMQTKFPNAFEEGIKPADGDKPVLYPYQA